MIPHSVCAFGITALGTIFITPNVIGFMGALPVSDAVKVGLLAGAYAVGSLVICEKSGLGKFL